MLVSQKKPSVVFVLSCALAVTGAARASVFEFQADLTGACVGSGSSATGTGTFTLDTTTGLFEWVIVHDSFASGELAAHIHGPQFSPICDLPPSDAGILVSLSNGSPKIGSTTLSASQQTDMLASRYYVNIHSNDFGSGEIKGIIEFIPPPVPTVSLWGLVALALVILAGATIGIRHRIRSVSV